MSPKPSWPPGPSPSIPREQGLSRGLLHKEEVVEGDAKSLRGGIHFGHLGREERKKRERERETGNGRKKGGRGELGQRLAGREGDAIGRPGRGSRLPLGSAGKGGPARVASPKRLRGSKEAGASRRPLTWLRGPVGLGEGGMGGREGREGRGGHSPVARSVGGRGETYGKKGVCKSSLGWEGEWGGEGTRGEGRGRGGGATKWLFSYRQE